MAMIKTMLEDKIMELAKEAGYDYMELMEYYWSYAEDCEEDGVPIDWDEFASEAREHDWDLDEAQQKINYMAAMR